MGKRIRRLSACFLMMIIICLSASSAFGETHEYEVSLIKRAEENTQGLRRYTCQICGYSYDEVIPATGHLWSEWICDKEATETEEGHMYRKCTRHEDYTHIEEASIPATGVIIKPPVEGEDLIETIEEIINEPPAQVLEESLGEEASAEYYKDSEAIETTEKEENRSPVLVAPVKAIPIGAADVAIATADGFAFMFFILLLLPYFRALSWAKNKRKKVIGEENDN